MTPWATFGRIIKKKLQSFLFYEHPKLDLPGEENCSEIGINQFVHEDINHYLEEL